MGENNKGHKEKINGVKEFNMFMYCNYQMGRFSHYRLHIQCWHKEFEKMYH